MRQRVAIDRQEPPRHAPAILAELRFTTREVHAGLIPVGDPASRVGRVDRHSDLIEFRPVAVAAMRRAQAAKLMQDRLKSLRQAAKVDYKSGFAPPAKK